MATSIQNTIVYKGLLPLAKELNLHATWKGFRDTTIVHRLTEKVKYLCKNCINTALNVLSKLHVRDANKR